MSHRTIERFGCSSGIITHHSLPITHLSSLLYISDVNTYIIVIFSILSKGTLIVLIVFVYAVIVHIILIISSLLLKYLYEQGMGPGPVGAFGHEIGLCECFERHGGL